MVIKGGIVISRFSLIKIRIHKSHYQTILIRLTEELFYPILPSLCPIPLHQTIEEMRQTVIHIHGAGPKHYRSLKDGSGDWQAKLATDLGKSFKVISPEMPSPRKPDYEEWKELLEKKLARAKGDLIFVGHSLGGSFLLKYLSENTINQKILALFIIAAPFNTVKGFEVQSHAKAQKIQLYHCMDDVEVPFAHAVKFSEFLGAELKSFSNRGHFFKRCEFVEIVQDIRALQIETYTDIAL